MKRLAAPSDTEIAKPWASLQSCALHGDPAVASEGLAEENPHEDEFEPHLTAALRHGAHRDVVAVKATRDQ